MGTESTFATATKKDMENQELFYLFFNSIEKFEDTPEAIGKQIKVLQIQNKNLKKACTLLCPV